MNCNYRQVIMLAGALSCVWGLSACSTWDKLDNREKGAAIGVGSGAALGGVVGGTEGAVVGGVVGGVAGGVIGHNTDED